jgi:hypothetical protein
VRPSVRSARPGLKRSTSIDNRPATSSSVPAALAQLNLNVADEGASPFGFWTSRPGQSNSLVRSSRKSLIGPHCASAKTRMMRMYGAKAATISPVESWPLPSFRLT